MQAMSGKETNDEPMTAPGRDCCCTMASVDAGAFPARPGLICSWEPARTEKLNKSEQMAGPCSNQELTKTDHLGGIQGKCNVHQCYTAIYFTHLTQLSLTLCLKEAVAAGLQLSLVQAHPQLCWVPSVPSLASSAENLLA